MGDFPGHPFRGNQYTHGALVSHLTQEDAKRSALARASGRYDNPHAIALELQAADRVRARVNKGEDPDKAFSDEFNPTASNHRIAKKMGLGLDVVRGQWVPKQEFVPAPGGMTAEEKARMAGTAPMMSVEEARRQLRETDARQQGILHSKGNVEAGFARALEGSEKGVSVSKGDYLKAKRAKTTSAKVNALLNIADKLAKQNPTGLLAQTRKKGHSGR